MSIEWLPEADEGTVAYVENKGWKSPSDLLQSYRGAETLRGVPAHELIRIPKADSTPEDMAAFFGKIGRPETPDKYEITPPEGQDKSFSEWAKGTFHRANLTAAQAKAIAGEWDAYLGEMHTKQTTAKEERFAAEVAELKREWAKGYEGEEQKVKVAIKKMGMEEADFISMQEVMGYAKTMKRLAAIGETFGEDSFVTGSSVAMTPARAQERIASLQKDAGWIARYRAKDRAAVEEMTNLMQMAYPT